MWLESKDRHKGSRSGSNVNKEHHIIAAGTTIQDSFKDKGRHALLRAVCRVDLPGPVYLVVFHGRDFLFHRARA